jgi:hypothetical protein
MAFNRLNVIESIEWHDMTWQIRIHHSALARGAWRFAQSRLCNLMSIRLKNFPV